MHARLVIDSLDFARRGQKMSGEIPVAELPRLRDVLENQRGFLKYAVQGVFDEQGNPALHVSIAGSCQLRCQRCLSALDYAMQLDTRLLLRSQAELDALDESTIEGQEEEFESILADAHLDVLDLLEDEILLSLPIAPRHEEGACQAILSGSAQEEKQHPFAVLAKLKRN